MTFNDQTLTCRDCGGQFVFTAGEQTFYQAKQLENIPGRCPNCRLAYKRARGIVNDSAQRNYHVTVCAECGQEAKVPFVPRDDRPVYCSPCFDHVKPTLLERVADEQPQAMTQ